MKQRGEITTFEIAEKLERIARDLRVKNLQLNPCWELSGKDNVNCLKYTIRFEWEEPDRELPNGSPTPPGPR